MNNISFLADDEITSRIQEYQRTHPDVPNKSEVIRSALDEFLPEIDDQAADEQGAAG